MSRGRVFAVATCVWIVIATNACGQSPGGDGGFSGGRGGGGGRHGGGGGGGRQERFDPGRDFKPPPPQEFFTPHGGEYLETEANHYEVVYTPLQTRIYLYDKKGKPLSAREVHAQMSFTLPSESVPRRIAFQYVVLPAGMTDQDYVVAVFDNRQLPEGETPITFEFSGLSDHHHPTAEFTPVFTPAKIRPYVVKVPLTSADRDGVMRQRVCPVSGEVLGTKGPIIKVYVADYPLYLARQDCIEAVQRSPERFLPHPAMTTPPPRR